MVELEKIHFGKLVLKRMKERGWKVKTLARNIGKTETATYKILGKKQLHTSVMVMLCKALRYNFFCEYCTEDLPDVKGMEEKKIPPTPCLSHGLWVVEDTEEYQRFYESDNFGQSGVTPYWEIEWSSLISTK